MVSNSPRQFVRILSPALRQAAAIARALEGRVENRPKRGEASDVKAALTIADTASQEALLIPLLEHFPDVRVEAEEDTPSVHGFALEGDAHVVIDPIDGTLRSYLLGEGPYAVMIGLAIKGRFEAALVALPREGLFLDAVRGGGARLADGPDRPRRATLEPGGRRVMVSHDLPAGLCEELGGRGYEATPGCGGAIAVAPLLPGYCAGLRVAAGPGGTVSPRGRIGTLIAAEAGARLCREGGQPFPEPIAAPARALVTAATREDLEGLLRALAAVDLDAASRR